MLIVSRRNTESIVIRPGDDADPNMTLADLFRSGPIQITLFHTAGNRVKLGVQAPELLAVRRKNAAETRQLLQASLDESVMGNH